MEEWSEGRKGIRGRRRRKERAAGVGGSEGEEAKGWRGGGGVKELGLLLSVACHEFFVCLFVCLRLQFGSRCVCISNYD